MEYKVLIILIVPEIEESYELCIPTCKTIGEITVLIEKMVNELSKTYPIKANAFLCNRYSNTIYKPDLFIHETDIRNGTELILFQ